MTSLHLDFIGGAYMVLLGISIKVLIDAELLHV
jgi:hypothetical protein